MTSLSRRIRAVRFGVMTLRSIHFAAQSSICTGHDDLNFLVLWNRAICVHGNPQIYCRNPNPSHNHYNFFKISGVM